MSTLSEPLVAAVVTSQLAHNEGLWAQCLRGLGQSLGRQMTLREAGQTGGLGAQLLLLMAADTAVRPEETSLAGLVASHGCEVDDWIAALFTQDVRRQFMSVRPTAYTEVQRINFGSTSRPVARTPRAKAGTVNQVSNS